MDRNLYPLGSSPQPETLNQRLHIWRCLKIEDPEISVVNHHGYHISHVYSLSNRQNLPPFVLDPVCRSFL